MSKFINYRGEGWSFEAFIEELEKAESRIKELEAYIRKTEPTYIYAEHK